MIEFPALPLVRYAQRINYRECAFFGITHPDNARYACRELWSQHQRENVQQALLLAQEQIERVINYPLAPKWYTDEMHLIRDERGKHINLYQTSVGHIIAPGVMSETMIAEDAYVDYAHEPAEIIIPNVTCAVEDVHVFHANTDVQISTTKKVIEDGVLTIQIPWCRMLDPKYWYETDPIMYEEVITWGAHEVDVKCIANDDTTQAVLHGRRYCAKCETQTTDACMYVKQPRFGLVTIAPEACTCGHYDGVSLNYYAGQRGITRIAEDAIIRLAHAMMPTEPCGCEVTQRMWARDREMPKYFLSRERINAPFGMTEGAWYAWIFANSQKQLRGSLWA